MRTTSLAVLAVFSWTSVASAEIVTRYTFTGNNGTETFEPTSLVAPNVTATNLTRGIGTNPAALANSFAANNWVGPAGTDFFAFTLTPTSGYQISLTNIDLGVVRAGGNAGSRSFALRSSLDGFASNLATVPVTMTASSQTMTFAAPFSFTGATTFRLTVLGATDNGGVYALTNQGSTPGLVMNGTVAAIPEPSVVVLLGLAGAASAGLHLMRRRRYVSSG